MGQPIRCFVGPNGSGKTLAAVELVAMPALNSGRRVVSTITIRHPLARRLQTWREISSLRNCVLLLDEISSILPSRGAQSVPSQLVTTLQQLRKPDVDVVWTGPNWARADVVLREVTQAVTVCRGSWGDPYLREPEIPRRLHLNPPTTRTADGNKIRHNGGWPANRLFRWITYDAQQFDEFTLHAVKDLKPMSRAWYWRPFHSTQWQYDTYEPVALLDHVDETGVCLICGGKKVRHTCHCDDAPRRARRSAQALAATPGPPQPPQTTTEAEPPTTTTEAQP